MVHIIEHALAIVGFAVVMGLLHTILLRVRVFCEHELLFQRGIYGDEITARSGKRSLWLCVKCERTYARAELFTMKGPYFYPEWEEKEAELRTAAAHARAQVDYDDFMFRMRHGDSSGRLYEEIMLRR